MGQGEGRVVSIDDLDRLVSDYSAAVTAEDRASVLASELVKLRRVIDRLELSFS